jgi:outer membrane receptor protein involved in Fe transport
MGRGRLQLFMSTAAATAAAFTTVAHAQQSPPPPPPAAGADASGEAAVQEEDPVVVLAPGDQVRIDRRTYTLRDDPAAQSSDMFDVLGRIPSVSVAPSGAVTLLGASGVTIQLNGQPVASDNLEQVLRGITGAEVERIEVITNPSAQYSAAASGGIINIITRQRVDTGFNGSVQARADTLGGHSVNISPSWSRGPWSLSGGLAFWDSEQQRDSRRERTILSSGVTTLEEGDQETAFNGHSLSRLQLGYRPTTRRRFMFTLNHSRRSSDLQLETETTEGSAPLSNQSNVSTSDSSSDGVIFDFQQDGARPANCCEPTWRCGTTATRSSRRLLSLQSRARQANSCRRIPAIT